MTRAQLFITRTHTYDTDYPLPPTELHLQRRCKNHTSELSRKRSILFTQYTVIDIQLCQTDLFRSVVLRRRVAKKRSLGSIKERWDFCCSQYQWMSLLGAFQQRLAEKAPTPDPRAQPRADRRLSVGRTRATPIALRAPHDRPPRQRTL